MVKNVFFNVNSVHRDALAVVGWLAFASGVLIPDPIGLKLVLLSVARVLP